jgi:hypothetical protein
MSRERVCSQACLVRQYIHSHAAAVAPAHRTHRPAPPSSNHQPPTCAHTYILQLPQPTGDFLHAIGDTHDVAQGCGQLWHERPHESVSPLRISVMIAGSSSPLSMCDSSRMPSLTKSLPSIHMSQLVPARRQRAAAAACLIWSSEPSRVQQQSAEIASCETGNRMHAAQRSSRRLLVDALCRSQDLHTAQHTQCGGRDTHGCRVA